MDEIETGVQKAKEVRYVTDKLKMHPEINQACKIQTDLHAQQNTIEESLVN